MKASNVGLEGSFRDCEELSAGALRYSIPLLSFLVISHGKHKETSMENAWFFFWFH